MSENRGRYCDKSLVELKKCLRERGLKVCGKKKTLIERLEFDDRTSQRDEPMPEFHMLLPTVDLYKDLHADHKHNFPPVTKARLTDFLATCQKSYDSKMELLYDQRYVRHLRSASWNNHRYVTSAVWAEMKKTTCYKVDICLDENGVVVEAQCECAVGQGPSAHCKHVCCTLYALTQFCATGDLITEVTCTQQLQTFHKAQPHRGSPLKTKNLNEARGRQHPMLYDPRPIHKRNPAKTEEHLRNVVLNWQGTSRWPVLQKYGPANIKALAADHDYMKLSWEDHFLEQLKVTHITEEEINDIEESTRGQDANSTWASQRKMRMTSSNFGVICKRTDVRNTETLLRTLMTSSHLSSDAVKHGKKYEGVAVQKFEELTGSATQQCGIFVALSHPMLAASPDRVIDSDTLLEVKCPFSSRKESITEDTVTYLTTVDGELTLKRNHDYYYQVQGQLYCARRKLCKFVVFTFEDMKVMDIPVDQSFTELMLTKLETFYEDVFKKALIQKYFYKNTNNFGE